MSDGDTLVLRNRQRLRLIGIDTPEMGRRGRAPEPYAREAKAALGALTAGKVVRIQDGRFTHDRYGRRLAHVFLANGDNVQALLLRRGLATLLFVPPNGEYLACYARAEAEARIGRRGIWSLAGFQPIAAKRLGKPLRGYRVVTGAVTSASCRRTGVRLMLDGALRVEIGKHDLRYFKGWDLCRLGGRQISVRGRVRRHRGAPRIRIRHPAYLDFPETAAR